MTNWTDVNGSGPAWPRPPHAPLLPTGEVHVYTAALDRSPDETDALARLLTTEEKERANRMRQRRDADRSVAARGLLRAILSWYVDEGPADLRIVCAPNGKPELAPDGARADVHFSVSHSDGLVVYAITATGPIGVDVERIRRLPELAGLIRLCCSAGERDSLDALEGDARRVVAFIAAWTRKEALLKATGEGLSGEMSTFEVSLAPLGEPRVLAHPRGTDGWSLRQVDPSPGYLGALALRDAITDVRAWRCP